MTIKRQQEREGGEGEIERFKLAPERNEKAVRWERGKGGKGGKGKLIFL